jgi:hypothetical protein
MRVGLAILLLCEELLVAVVRSNPEPDEAFRSLFCQGAVTKTHASRPENAYLLQSQRRMTRILPK